MKYYLHDTGAFDDEKVSELFINFGYEGLGLFYTILEKLAKQEKPIKTTVLKSQLKVGKKLNKCWLFMEQIDIISSNNGDTFNKQLLNYSEKYKIKKEKTAKKVSEWRENQVDSENVTSYKNKCNRPKVKESKVKESKCNIITVEKSTVYPDFIFIYDQFIQKVNGSPAKINQVQGKNAKEIIAYLKTACIKKNPNSGNAEIINSWQWLLDHYDKWSSFHQTQLDLRQINSNLQNIIRDCKNGNQQRSGKQPATSFEDIDRIAELIFNGNINVPGSGSSGN